jgi:hypothetical protein
MSKLWKRARWILPGVALYALGGCVTSQQLFDFFRTEVARISADVVGQLFTIFTQATT